MATNKKKDIDRELALKLLRYMHLSRKFEEQVQHYFSLGMIYGTAHLGIGEEATAVGTCLALQEQDEMYATHRGHGQAVSKGIDINAMMAEIFSKKTGVCKGKGGSMHIADKDKGVLGANGILGSSLPLACGVALAHKKRQEKDIVTAVFFGEGSTNEGAFHEAMNLAAVWQLPLMFVCINNTYGMSTHISKVMNDIDLTKRAIPYGMKAMEVDGNDVMAVYEATLEARKYVYEGNGPILLVENTYRTSGHSKSDGNLYRTKEEINYWKERAPIPRFEKVLLEGKICTQKELDSIDTETTEVIEKAVKFAIDSPYPDISEAYEDVYAD